ncbi:MAG: SUF system NifU family Fe-S cluster assembly protein [Candidatus Hydrogenedentota bacterium]|nr:MAG: SUF system NifU family Fe-S cluster assembly protein [Candidatus Hydrogenedentota bacterium]
MSKNRALYEQVILDHNKSPRNYGVMDDPDLHADGYNALCGDQFTVYLKMDGDVIEDMRFDGSGCAISKSSASVMTTLLKGKTKDEAQALFAQFKDMITSEVDSPLDEEALGKLKVFGGVREYPVRIKCATLAWHTLASALEGDDEAVSTE